MFYSVDPQFSEEEVALFTKRFDNGYDLHDSRYEEWLSWRTISPGPPSKHIPYLIDPIQDGSLTLLNIYVMMIPFLYYFLDPCDDPLPASEGTRTRKHPKQVVTAHAGG